MAEALREIIANALDEQALTGTADPEIFEDDGGRWFVRDYGRGLRYDHFTQNEDPEKLAKPILVIGKFGVGLKDAMATFDRNGVTVEIRSRYSTITFDSVAKRGFDDVLTLHAVVDDPSDSAMVGTEFVFSGLTAADVNTAKSIFLKYSDDVQLEQTRYGSVLQRQAKAARIYVNGLRVAERAELPLRLQHHLAHEGAPRLAQPRTKQRGSPGILGPRQGHPSRLLTIKAWGVVTGCRRLRTARLFGFPRLLRLRVAATSCIRTAPQLLHICCQN